MRTLISPALAAALLLAHPALAQEAAPAPETAPVQDTAPAQDTAGQEPAPAEGAAATAAPMPPATADQGATGAPDAADATAVPETDAAGAAAAPPAAGQPETGSAEATPATPVTAETVVATVNGTEIKVGHLLVAKTRLPEQYREVPDEMLFGALLQQLIQQQALADRAGPLSKASEYTLDNERRALAVSEMVDAHVQEAVTEEAIRKTYDDVLATAEPDQEYSAAHILVESEEDAQALVDELAGGADFAELAKTKSTGPSAPSGGDLGWFSKGMMVPEFETAVTALEPGEVSGPVQSQFGWHVIRLNEVREKPAPTFEEVRDQVAQGMQQQAVQALLAEAAQSAEVTTAEDGAIPPAVLSDPALLDN